MKSLLYFVLRIFFKAWMKKGQQDVVSDIKAKSIVAYLRLLNGARMSLVGIVTVFLVMQLIVFGLALMVGTAVFLVPIDMNLKLWALFALGGLLFLVPILGISILLSQRLWYRASGADKMVSDLLEKSA